MSILAVVPKLFNRQWWWKTLFIIAAVAVCIRLGFWQLDRLEQRRAFNQRVADRWQLEPFDVNNGTIPSDLSELEYRRVQATGEFDYSHQILLSSQSRNEAPGAVVVTPYVLDDGRAILVARGWLPSGEYEPENWSKYEEPAGQPVIGLIQESQLLPNGNAPTPPKAPQVEWFQINIDAIQPQMPYELLPVFILQLPEEGRSYNALPFREEPLRLDEGSHFSYAIQWYTFALIFGVGYLFLIHSQELREQHNAGTLQDGATQEMDTQEARPEKHEVADIATMSQREGHA